MYQQLQVLIYILLYGVSFAQALTIREEPLETTTTPNTYPGETSTYRITLAKAQNPSQRVPSHLQRVRNAFVYEDADDVIHVIDPPKHFEELKKLMKNRQKATQRPQTRVTRPVAKDKPQQKKQPHYRTRKPSVDIDSDLEIQETEHLPVEILASVRKTENYLKKYKPKIPSAPRQRVKTKKIHTVIWEKGQENQQFIQGQEKKVNGVREFHQIPAKNLNRRKFIKKRIKRQTAALTYHPLTGEDLLDHINELVKNASKYLENFNTFEDIEAGTSTTTYNGDVLTRTTGRPYPNPFQPKLREEDVIEILENSIKATSVIMEQIKGHTNYSNISQNCEYSRVDGANHIQSLRQQIECMQNIIQIMNDTKFHEQPLVPTTQIPPETSSNNKRYGERLSERKTKDLRHKPFLVATVEDEYFEDASPSPLNTSLIYDDVMTTIRNLLQATNLQALEESTLPSSPAEAAGSSETIAAWEEITIPQDNSQEPVDFHNLNQYLNSLQTIVTNLPQPTNSSLNLYEIESKPSKYYFINPLGGIYNLPQPFHPKDRRPSPPSTIFRQFPDIPSISEYLGTSGSLLKASQNVIEIL